MIIKLWNITDNSQMFFFLQFPGRRKNAKGNVGFYRRRKNKKDPKTVKDAAGFTAACVSVDLLIDRINPAPPQGTASPPPPPPNRAPIHEPPPPATTIWQVHSWKPTEQPCLPLCLCFPGQRSDEPHLPELWGWTRRRRNKRSVVQRRLRRDPSALPPLRCQTRANSRREEPPCDPMWCLWLEAQWAESADPDYYGSGPPSDDCFWAESHLICSCCLVHETLKKRKDEVTEVIANVKDDTFEIYGSKRK